jgi:polyisoprenoid-binding protein YceI
MVRHGGGVWVLALVIAACGGAGVTALPPATASATGAPSGAAAALTGSPSPAHLTVPAGAIGFAVADGSKAVIRVNEQVAGVALPGEAVVTTTAMDGEFVLLADGTFAKGSRIRADLERLKSDNDLRDEWIKFNTLQTRLYRYAEFTPSRLTGVALPLPAAGTWTAKLEGTMRIRTTEKPVTWDLAVVRDASGTTAGGAIVFQFGDYGMAVPANRLVLSVKDEVRLRVDLVVTELR